MPTAATAVGVEITDNELDTIVDDVLQGASELDLQSQLASTDGRVAEAQDLADQATKRRQLAYRLRLSMDEAQQVRIVRARTDVPWKIQ